MSTESARVRTAPGAQRAASSERFIPGFLLDSPLSRLGYLYGSSIGWVWGSLWSTGKIEKRGEMWVFRGMPSWTFKRGGICVGTCFLTGDGRIDDRIIRHETVHKRQWQRYGMLMPILYLLAGRNPLRNRFEIEAGLADGNYLPRELVSPNRSGT